MPLTGQCSQPENAGPAGQEKSDDFNLCHKIWDGELHAAPDPSGRVHDCIIAGGGMSGVVTAWKLQQLGVNEFLLIERNPELGGPRKLRKSIDGISAASRLRLSFAALQRRHAMLYLDLGFVRPAQGTKTELHGVRLDPPPQSPSRCRRHVRTRPTAYCPLPASSRRSLLKADVLDWQTRILGEFDQCLPGLSRTATAFHLHRWGHAFRGARQGFGLLPLAAVGGKAVRPCLFCPR